LFLNLKLNFKKLLQYTILLFSILSPSFLLSSDRIEVQDIRYWSSADYTRVVIDLSETVEFTQNRLTDPDRLYVDLANAIIKKEINTKLPVGDGILKMVRAGQFSPDKVRVVLDLEKITDFNIFFLGDPARLVIDIYGKEKTKKPDIKIAKRTIVIDPGHGGHDPGAVGFNGLYEKDVVLDIALKLKKILSCNTLNDVFLTRETDIFIPLEERTFIANKKNADLFVSIHANASPLRKTKGIETYFLNWTDDDEANKVAARENQISLKKMKEMNRKRNVLDMMLGDLTRQNNRDESVKLANYIQNSLVLNLKGDQNSTSDLGVKWALFFVLYARMPAVLVEVSFISNPEEGKLLSRESYRKEIAESIAEGIDKYFTSVPTFQNVVESKNYNH
jgi:N-acetylmuramoyl-L-alanine amidase